MSVASRQQPDPAARPRWVDPCPWRKSAVNYSGSHEEIRCFAILGANATGQAAKCNPDDVSVLGR